MNKFVTQLLFITLLLAGCRAAASAPASPLPTVVASGRSALQSPLPTPIPPVTITAITTDTIPTNTCSTAAEEPGAVAALQAELQLTEALFFQWYCAGAGLGDIRKAYAVQAETGQPIETIFEQFFAGVGWGSISQPATQTALDPEEQLCLAEHSTHREVMNIAEEFTQPAARIAGIFCKGVGFGEIRNALAIHKETDVPLEEIVARFQNGQSWATIRAELNAAPLQGDPTGND